MKTKLLYESPAFLLTSAVAPRDFLELSREVAEDETATDIFEAAYGYDIG